MDQIKPGLPMRRVMMRGRHGHRMETGLFLRLIELAILKYS